MLFLVAFFIPRAHANGLPVATLNEGSGGVLWPFPDCPIGVRNEHLVIEIKKDREVLVTATYLFKNESSEKINSPIVFPLPKNALSSDCFRVGRCLLVLSSEKIRKNIRRQIPKATRYLFD